MGTDETSDKKTDSSYINDLSDVSDFYGLKSKSIENVSNQDEQFYTRTLKKDSESKTSELNNLIKTTFEWDGEGNSVYVTGSFCKWNQFFLMRKDSEKNFNLTLNLPRGYHQYKFKVDGEWKYNTKFPICNDYGYINNYLDTTNLEITVKNNNDEGITAISTYETDNCIDISKISRKYSKNQINTNSDLNQFKNQKQNLEKICGKITSIPIHYKNSMNIDLITNQNKIGSNKYFKINENNAMSDNLAYKKINVAPNEQINHLNSKLSKDETNIWAVCSRYRYKFTTFVYYKPNKH